jgi:hypothetical protein
MQFHLEWKNRNQEEILYIFASLVLGYLVTKYAMKQGISKRFWPLMIFFTLFFYIFFQILSKESFSFFQENFTNGLDDEETLDALISNEVSGEISGEISGYDEKKPIPHPSESSGETNTPSETSGSSGGTNTPSETSGTSTEEVSGEETQKMNINGIINRTGDAYGPLNINVSYKTIDMNGGSSKEGRCVMQNPYQDNIDDLGKYNYKSRVHNNKGWMDSWEKTNYGTQAWTLDPDFYIPGANEPKNPPEPTPIHPRPQFQNEINYSHNLRKEKCPVCPLEINKPWSEYQSGDKEPEGFNL